MRKNISISSINDYVERIKTLNDNCFFRGQSNFTWLLEPSLYRNENFMIYENRMLEELSIKHPDEYAKFNKSYAQLLKAQHYGLPTRLLDITSNPFVALYFAVNGSFTVEGKIYVIENISGASSHDRDKQAIAIIANSPDSSKIEDIQSIYNQKFNNGFPSPLSELFIVESTYDDNNNRSFIQGAHSIVFGVHSNINNTIDKKNKIIIPNNMIKHEFIVPKEEKKSILKILDEYYGISEKTLLLSVENTTSLIKEMYVERATSCKYKTKKVADYCEDIILNKKYPYIDIENIIHEVDATHHVMQYRVYITEDDVSQANLICLARHSKKHFEPDDKISEIRWYYNYDARRIYNRKDI